MSNLKKYTIYSASTILLILLDQFTKYVAGVRLKGHDSFVILKGVFELHYLENRGAAFGMLQNQRLFFVIMTMIMMMIILWCYQKTPDDPHYIPLKLCGILISAGAIGNFIDRVFLGYVIDFFYFSLINFPIFNVADIYVVIGFALLSILILFYYKEEELNVYSIKRS